MRRALLSACALALVSSSCGVAVVEDVPVAVSRAALCAAINAAAAKATVAGYIDVTWSACDGATNFRVFTNGSSAPPALFTSVQQLGEGWAHVATPAADATSFRHQAFAARSYVVCAEDVNATGGSILVCSPLTARVTPDAVLDGASLNNLRITAVSQRSLRAAWVESFATVRSEVSISPPPESGAASVVDDADETHTFGNLMPGVLYTITGCAQSEGQLARGESTCGTVGVRTLPDAPLGLDSLLVDTGNTSRSQRVRFTDDNPPATATRRYDVRLFVNGASTFIQEKTVTATTGPQSHVVDFTGLTPFTSYEVWVIPYNAAGVGPAADIGFTTAAEVRLTATPLSGTSAMLTFNADAFGDYEIERRVGTTVTQLSRVRVTTPDTQRVVLDEMAGTQLIRVRWRLAGMTSVSNEVSAARGPSGAPELVTGRLAPLYFIGNPLPLRGSATFTPTISDFGKGWPSISASYVLLTDNLAGSTSTLATLSTLPFIKGEPESLAGTSSMFVSNLRACRQVISSTGSASLACSAGPAFASSGRLRVH